MRDTYHEELDKVVSSLVGMTHQVRTAVQESTTALLGADTDRADAVINHDKILDAEHDDLEERCFQLLARQAPVAGELRVVVAALRMAFGLARMGDLAVHVAEIARMRAPEIAVPEPLRDNFRRMAAVADDMIATTARTLEERDAATAKELATSDEEMDDLRRDQFRILLGSEWTHGVEAAVDVALLGRYYERIADHAVSMGRRIIYVITGSAPTGEAWPNA